MFRNVSKIWFYDKIKKINGLSLLSVRLYEIFSAITVAILHVRVIFCIFISGDVFNTEAKNFLICKINRNRRG